jgi:alpha-D-glucose phosphate-specific phosphoglucomutase
LIKFGTDGWRGVIADDFTFENVRLVSQAVCDYVLEEAQKSRSAEAGNTEPTLVIGYDTRFLSDRFAVEAATVAAGNGIKVLLTDTFAPTPTVSYAVVDRKTDGAIMFTASHNPYRYNGLKFKAPYGGSATPEITDEIERHLEKNVEDGRQPDKMLYEEALASGAIRLIDIKIPYLKRLSEIVDMDVIRKMEQRVVVDPMHGAGCGYLREFLSAAGCEVLEIHGHPDPYFGGGQPEPLGQHLADLTKAVKGSWPMGIALDGDADRIGAIDNNGEFISSHQIFSMLLRYLCEEKGLTGDVVKTVSTTGMIDLLATKYSLTLHETPIGFKYICDYMLSGDVLIGGEESGGIGVKGHIPERDGILMGALLVEMCAFYGKTLTELWFELEKEYGKFCYDRIDIEVDCDSRESIVSFLKGFRPDEIEGGVVERVNDMDGYKYYLTDKSWLMIRPSGTEAVIRIYAEADSHERVKKLLQEGEALIAEAQENPGAWRG